MYHLSDIKKFLLCERLYYFGKDDNNVFKPFLCSDDNIIDLIKEYFHIEKCFNGIRNDENDGFFSALIALNRRGFVIEFDSMGGSYIEPQKHMYGEKIEYIVPQRDGYTFEGWSTSQSCLDMLNEDAEIVDSMKLYACWIE